MNAVIQYPNRAAQRKSRIAATLRRKEEERVFRAIHGMERDRYTRYTKEYGQVVVVTTAVWYREVVTRLESEGGSGFVWMRHWPHYKCGVLNGVVGDESSCFTYRDE